MGETPHDRELRLIGETLTRIEDMVLELNQKVSSLLVEAEDMLDRLKKSSADSPSGN